MKRIRRFLALLGVVLLIALYAVTLFCALTDHSDSMVWFKASLLTTFLIPVLLWTYTFVYRMIRGNSREDFLSAPEEEGSDETDTDVSDSGETEE